MTKTPSECNSLYPALFLVVFSLPQCFSIVHCEGSVSLLSSELLPFFFYEDQRCTQFFVFVRSCDNTLENFLFQISPYSRAYVRIIYKT